MILIVSFPSLRILIFFFLFAISLSLITWVVGHAGFLLRRTAPLIFRGQIGLALEKAAKTNFHLEDVYNSSNKAIMEFLFFFSLSSIVSRLAYQCFYLGRTLLGCILPSVCFHLGSADI